jgi:hypothetical protein
MTREPIPLEDAQKISDRAIVLARQDLTNRGWSQGSIESLVTNAKEGEAGIRTTKNYLMYQERGIKPFIMWWVDGRIIPIHDSTGVHLVTGKEPGQPGYVTLPGGVKKWREQKWRHPGLEPKNFMENALRQAIDEYKHPMKTKFVNAFKRLGDLFG